MFPTGRFSGECTICWVVFSCVRDLNKKRQKNTSAMHSRIETKAKALEGFLSFVAADLEHTAQHWPNWKRMNYSQFFFCYLRFLRFCNSWELPILILPLLKLLLLCPEPILIDWQIDWWWMVVNCFFPQRLRLVCFFQVKLLLRFDVGAAYQTRLFLPTAAELNIHSNQYIFVC